jgi:hypothetical protein
MKKNVACFLNGRDTALGVSYRRVWCSFLKRVKLLPLRFCVNVDCRVKLRRAKNIPGASVTFQKPDSHFPLWPSDVKKASGAVISESRILLRPRDREVREN